MSVVSYLLVIGLVLLLLVYSKPNCRGKMDKRWRKIKHEEQIIQDESGEMIEKSGPWRSAK
jgi:hypothetical protein